MAGQFFLEICNFCGYESWWGYTLKPESDYALNIEIEDCKIEIWPIKTIGAKIPLSSNFNFQSSPSLMRSLIPT